MDAKETRAAAIATLQHTRAGLVAPQFLQSAKDALPRPEADALRKFETAHAAYEQAVDETIETLRSAAS